MRLRLALLLLLLPVPGWAVPILFPQVVWSGPPTSGGGGGGGGGSGCVPAGANGDVQTKNGASCAGGTPLSSLVVGPASSNGDRAAVFDGATGKLLKDSKVGVLSDGDLTLGDPTTAAEIEIAPTAGGVAAAGGKELRVRAGVPVLSNENGGELILEGGDPTGTGTKGPVRVLGSMRLETDVTPTQLTADVNDYAGCAVGSNAVCRLSSDAYRRITGLAAGADGAVIALRNVGSFPIALMDESQSTASAAANRFQIGAGGLSLGVQQTAVFRYDDTASRWAIFSSGGSPVNYLTLSSIAATVSADTNDWAPTGFSTSVVIVATPTAAYNISGMTHGGSGSETKIVYNAAEASTLTFLNESPLSSATNRFKLPQDLTLNPNESAIFRWSSAAARWTIVAFSNFNVATWGGINGLISDQDDLQAALDAEVTAPSGTGLLSQTAVGTWATRTLSSTLGTINFVNPGGIAGNPDLDVDDTIIPTKGSGTADRPATCGGGSDTFKVGDIYVETDANETCVCTTTNTWQCDSGANTGDVTADDQVQVGNGTIPQSKALPNGPVTYTTSTNTFSEGPAQVTHATDCTVLTTGILGTICLEEDSERFFTCQPTAGGCDTAGEWILTPASAGGTPGGSDTQCQFNDAGAFGGDAGCTYDKTNDNLTLLGRVYIGDGTEALPAHSYGAQTSTGFYRISSGVECWSGAGECEFIFNVPGAVQAHLEGDSTNNYCWASGEAELTTPDACVSRVAANVVQVKGASSASAAPGWMQNAAGDQFLTADATNATTTMSNLTDLTVDVTSGRKYSFRLHLFVSDSVSADGAVFDFDGGTATATNFRVHCTLFDTALLLSSQSSALATDFAQATVTGNGMFECYGSFEPSSTGTFIPRFAQNAHTTGTLTVYRGSYLAMKDMP